MNPIQFILIIWGSCALIIAVHFLLRKLRKKPILKNEKNRYYINMHKLGYRDWEIHEYYFDIESYEELTRINKKLESVVKIYNL